MADATTDTIDNAGAAALTTEQKPWYGDIKEPETAEWMKTKNFTDAETWATSHRQLEKLVGKERVGLPADDADITQWEGWDRLKVPKDAKGYEGKIARPKMPDGVQYDEAFEKEAIEAAAKLRVHPKHLQGMIDLVTTQRLKAIDAAKAAEKADTDAFNAEVESWGQLKDQKLELARRMAKEMGIDKETLAELGGLVGSAKLIATFAKWGQVLTEGRMVDGENRNVLTPEQAQAEIKSFRATNAAALSDVRHPQHADLQKQLTLLYKQAHPSERAPA